MTATPPAPLPPPSGGGRPRRPRRALRRRPLLLGVLVVAALGGLLLVASWVRPALSAGTSLAVEDARTGTPYAFDGAVCLSSGRVGATVRSVDVEQVAGATVRLVQVPEGSPPTLGFPVREGDGPPLVGQRVDPGQQDCVARLLVVPDREGTVVPGRVRVSFSYGPFGLLRRTASLVPSVTLEVTGPGPDPRVADDTTSR